MLFSSLPTMAWLSPLCCKRTRCEPSNSAHCELLLPLTLRLATRELQRCRVLATRFSQLDFTTAAVTGRLPRARSHILPVPPIGARIFQASTWTISKGSQR